MKKLTLAFVFLLAFHFSFGQEKLEIGISIGQSNYLGDLAEPTFSYDHGELAGAISLRYPLLDQLGIKSNLLVGKLVGDDLFYTANLNRDIDFSTAFLEWSLLGEYELFNIRGNSNERLLERLTPYVFAGVGLSLLDLDVNYGSTSEKIEKDKNEPYSDIQPVIPIGAGIKYRFSKNWFIGIETGLRATFTDYLDGVSFSGNPDKNDTYLHWAVTASYILGNTDTDNDGIADKKDKCPDLPGPLKFDGCPDTDGDGITDNEDDCPNDVGRPGLKGCPDADNDGVSDFVDDCPDHPGIRRLGGCPDTDNDGIVDLEDNCPNEAGIPSMNGCPDADRDGIGDAKDECPLEPGKLQLNGCPDNDNDGIADKDDKCPDQPGKANTQGCPDGDRDKDGVIDRRDQCPDLAGLIENGGCPEIEKEDQELLDFAMANVEFETGSDELKRASLQVLDQIADVMKRYKGYRLAIKGHTDNIGDPNRNKILSENRAKACYNYLFTLGINPTLLSYEGFGDTLPIANNTTIDGRRQNRRVEFILSVGQ